MRPCIVNGTKCVFHQWFNMADVIPPSARMGGHPGGMIAYPAALVEMEDGTMKTALAKNITFIDGLAERTLHERVTFEPKEDKK